MSAPHGCTVGGAAVGRKSYCEHVGDELSKNDHGHMEFDAVVVKTREYRCVTAKS